MAKSVARKNEIDLEPDAWQRFERAIDVVAKSPPQHRVKAKPKARKSPAKRKAVEKAVR